MDSLSDIVARVFEDLPLGRTASWPSMSLRMMEYIYEAGTQNHLEIGVMHGGTLIMAALVKKELCGGGKVVGVDPLDGYYPANALHATGVKTDSGCLITREHTDRHSDVPISRETLETNIDAFGVRDYIEIIQKFSYPWPAELDHSKFATVYIDGDHYQEGPLVDWVNVQRNVLPNAVVMFDDCNDNCPGVQRATQIAFITPGWHYVEHHQNHCFVMRKNDNA